MRGACRLLHQLTRSPSPPPWRVTSPSSKSASTPPLGPCHWPKGDPSRGAIPSLLAVSSWISSNTSLSWVSLRSLRAQWSCSGGPLGSQGEDWETASPPRICAWEPKGCLPLKAMNSHTYAPVGGQTWILMGSSCQTMAKVKRCIVAIISEPDQNPRMVSVSKSCSTPSGCTCPSPMHSLTMSYSWKESGWNGVPSPWVAARTHMQVNEYFSWVLKNSSTKALSLSLVIKLKNCMYGTVLYQKKYQKITEMAQGACTLVMYGSMQPEHKTQ